MVTGREVKPLQVYNMDETGMLIDHRPPNVVARKGQKKVRYRSAGNKSQVTVDVSVPLVKLYHLWSFLILKHSMQTGPKEKWLVRFTA